PSLLGPPVHEGRVRRDPIEPGGEASRAPEGRETPVDRQESLLEHVLGVRVAPGESTGEPIDAPLVAPHEGLEGARIARRGARGELLVRDRRDGGHACVRPPSASGSPPSLSPPAPG